MKITTPVAVGAGIVVIILFLVFGPSPPGDYDDFAQCITSSGAKMYGSYQCPHCNEQKEMFGNSWHYIDYVECAAPAGANQVCLDANVSGLPTWDFGNGRRVLGRLSFQELSVYTSCPFLG